MLIYKILQSVFYRLGQIFKILAIRMRYNYHVLRIRKKSRKSKLRVVFLVNESSKWKVQSLYDLMAASENYEPVVALTLADIDWGLSDVEQKKKYERNREFFRERNIKVVDGYLLEKRSPVPIAELNPDIVWYQQPWQYAHTQSPMVASIVALTCYVPYFVANYGCRDIDYGVEFHKELWRYFVLNKAWERLFSKMNHFWSYAGSILGLGHTGLDYFFENRQRMENEGEGYVIYAPHWSIDHPENENFECYSTFTWSGRHMLDFAKKHPSIKWVFKPHPSLRYTLQTTHLWTDEEIENYYSEWEKIGISCQTGNYHDLMVESSALITDCGSFLTEYFTTGKPLIRLVSPKLKLQPLPPSVKMFESFYNVRNLTELDNVLDMVLARKEDPMREQRIAVRKSMGLLDKSAAENILEYLNSKLHIQGGRR